MAAPIVPQRPARSQIPAPTAGMDIPMIPPRPKRNLARSISPQRDSFARSPLNDPANYNGKLHGSSLLSKSLTVDTPPRPPSVDFPTIGEEGHEYAQVHEHFGTPAAEEPAALELTKSIAGDLPLHAPKASLPAATAKSRISAVTRTDSNQAAAVGIGKAVGDDHVSHGLSRTSSTQPSRPTSLYSKDHPEGEELGIPEIGTQIPLYPNAGDVQAPSPSPALFVPGTGTGLTPHNGSQASLGRHHTRTKSGRDVFIGPPGSYGLHGHGVNTTDPFEKDWYSKHPSEMKREEQGEYGPAIVDHRKEWALSSDQLNKLVHGNDHPGMGELSASEISFGITNQLLATNPAVIGTPAEEVGYIASEEFASRMASPRPASAQANKERRPSSQVYAESPLRKMSFPVNEVPAVLKVGHGHDNAVDSEAEHDEDVIHVDPLSRTASRMEGAGYNEPTAELGPERATTEDEGDMLAENGYTAPILASDEAKYRPEAQYMQPAIEPELERSGSTYLDLEPSPTPPTYVAGRRGSRPGSRSNSINALPHMSRYATAEDRPEAGTPLEDVKEYEPLFPEEEDLHKQKAASEPHLPLADKMKRPDLARHHFPSKDVWEDVAPSLMFETTVKTPQISEFSIPAAEHEPKEIFETPEQEKARKAKIEAGEQQNFIPAATKKLAKTRIRADVLEDMPERPGLPARHKFPSQDVWEDTADHLLHTTVITPQPEKQEQPPSDQTSPVESTKAVPMIPARPSRLKVAAMDGTSTSPEEKKALSIPDRPKPKVPERPSKPLQRGSAEEVPLAKTTSGEEKVSPPVAKAKPLVPARPAGNKIAALQGGFMKDLNQRLQIGPQALKKEEPKEEVEEEKEKAPLADARKGRARGPQRRRPGVSPAAAAVGEEEKKAVRFEIAKMVTVFEIGEDGAVRVAPEETKKEAETLVREVEAVGEKSEEVPAAKEELVAATELKTEDERKTVDKVSGQDSATSKPAPAASADLSTPTETVKPLEKATSSSSDVAVQTGETKITMPTTDDTTEELTAYVDGRADKPGTVIEKDSEQHVAKADAHEDIAGTTTGV